MKKYQISDPSLPIFSDYPVVEADSGIKALEEYLGKKCIRSKDGNYKLTPFYEENVKKNYSRTTIQYKDGNVIWAKIK